VEVGVIGPGDTAIAEFLRASNIPVHASPIRHAFDIPGIRALRRRLSASNPDLVHAWGGRAVRFLSGRRLVASAASWLPGGLAGWLTARRLRQCDRIIAATWAEGERFCKLGVLGERLTRISTGVEIPQPSMDRASLFKEIGLPTHARFIAVAGPLEPNSGFKSAIWAFDLIRYEHPDWHLVIFGDGPDRDLLEQFGRALMFDDFRIHFASNRTDLPAILSHAGLVWITHERGGTTLALEAMAAGVPVIGWKTPDLAEIVVDGQTGFLVPTNDRARISAVSYPLVADAAARTKLGEAGRRRIAEHFSARHAIEQLTRLYDEVLE